MSHNMLNAKLNGHRNNVKTALIIGVVAIALDLVFGFSIDSLVWAISIWQLYRWYTLAETYIQQPFPDILDKLRGYRNTYVGLWIVAAVMSAIFWGVQGDLILGVVVSFAATYLMNQFETDATSISQPQSFQSSSPSQQMAPQSNPNASMVFCGQCGSQQAPSTKFCTNCGAKIGS